ncbi:TonB-dependent receptor [Flavobacterium sedimenticola]|uniref:TonB-dependent receptor n=1 Tax=Flavobacterium sedimenticola TaxID=3043286 RepID=A0ABT6XRD3_9FLAO|nr:TonB-dependent receptor [Flavobacterium sedimenticola]MDI9257583.1 TonB-dependent receptor [Flavobacterium sedimenticola]
MKPFYTLFLLFLVLAGRAQQTISGTVFDGKSKPIAGANIFIEGTYDGASTDEQGRFEFSTTVNGKQELVISFLTYETLKVAIDVAKCQNESFTLKESVNTLDAVVVTAGTFDAGEKARVSVLKPLDIVTTAGALGDIVSALQTLPGTQTVGEDGRLFVRGGEADETQTFIDGIRVAQPYGATTANVPTRGRFSPFLFSGMSFSTGGYSAEYGEALSSVLLLNTQDEATEEKTDISLMTVGLGLANTQKWKTNSLSFNTAYINLEPYQKVFPQRADWNKPFQSLSGEAVYRHGFDNGMFKLYAAFDASQFDINSETINHPDKIRVDLNNNNFYLNSSYKANFSGQWQLFSGLSYGFSRNKIGIATDAVSNSEHASHIKVKLKKSFSDRLKLSFGGDFFVTRFEENFKPIDSDTFTSNYNANLAALFAETDIFFSKKLAMKLGARLSNNSLLKEKVLSPRVSLAYKVSKNGQLAVAYGNFTQAPKPDYLKYADDLSSEKATHYIFNYQYSKDRRTFRAEWYWKEYDNLVKFDTEVAQFDSQYTNSGFGYAKGLDVFWRDNATVKNVEYWVSYSYIDTQRDYKNFSVEATPSFVAKHSLSVVSKWWINQWKSQLSVTNSFTTGRPYNNPNEVAFMSGRTKGYNNLSLGWAYLMTQQKILYFSVSNVLGTTNVFGYEYANTPNETGVYNRRAIRPTADQFFFVGFFWTISENKKDNQLNNL